MAAKSIKRIRHLKGFMLAFISKWFGEAILTARRAENRKSALWLTT
jgi:hypothetical protein